MDSLLTEQLETVSNSHLESQLHMSPAFGHPEGGTVLSWSGGGGVAGPS